MSRKWQPLKRLFAVSLCVVMLSTVASAATKLGDSQLENGSGNSVSLKDQYHIPVTGRTTVFQGWGDFPWGFSFADSKTGRTLDSFLLANALPITPEMAVFHEDWPHTAQYLYNTAYTYYGDILRFLSFDNAQIKPGDDVYVMYMELETPSRRMEVTVCFRFQQSYYAVYIGVNEGDMPEMFALTKKAAREFQDNTKLPFTAQPDIFYTRETAPDSTPWELPVTNVFSALRDYTRWEFAQGADVAVR